MTFLQTGVRILLVVLLLSSLGSEGRSPLNTVSSASFSRAFRRMQSSRVADLSFSKTASRGRIENPRDKVGGRGDSGSFMDDQDQRDLERKNSGRSRIDKGDELPEWKKRRDEEHKKTQRRDSGDVELRGHGSDIKMRGKGERRNGKFFQLKILKISDSDNQRIRLDNLEFNWTESITSTANGGTKTSYMVSATQVLEQSTESFSMSLEVVLTSNPIEIEYGNTTRLSMGPDDLKFTLTVENWPWIDSQTSDQELYVRFLYRSSGADVSSLSAGNEGSVRFGDMLAEMPLFAIADNVEVPVKIKYDYEVEPNEDPDVSATQDVVSNVLFIFPRFESQLVYDPILSVVANAAFTVNAFSSALVFAICTILFLI